MGMSLERKDEIILQPEPEGSFSIFVPELPSVATQDGVRAVEHAVDRDFGRMLKRPGGASLFKVKPWNIRRRHMS